MIMYQLVLSREELYRMIVRLREVVVQLEYERDHAISPAIARMHQEELDIMLTIREKLVKCRERGRLNVS